MCGRYTLLTPNQVTEIKAIIKEAEEQLRRRNTQNTRAHLAKNEVFPASLAPILKPMTGRFGAFPAFWGFTNHHQWENTKRQAEGKKPLAPSPTFNTRADKADTSPMWKQSFHTRRCVIPCRGFYEWRHKLPKAPGEKARDKGTEYFFTLPDQSVLYIAGIWQPEVDEATGESWDHFSMLTTQPSRSVEDIHNRMPVVLLRHELDQWIDGDYRQLLNRSHIVLQSQLVE